MKFKVKGETLNNFGGWGLDPKEEFALEGEPIEEKCNCKDFRHSHDMPRLNPRIEKLYFDSNFATKNKINEIIDAVNALRTNLE